MWHLRHWAGLWPGGTYAGNHRPPLRPVPNHTLSTFHKQSRAGSATSRGRGALVQIDATGRPSQATEAICQTGVCGPPAYKRTGPEILMARV